MPTAVRFLSIEPLLEDLGRLDLCGIDWVIVGGESGISIVRQCRLVSIARSSFYDAGTGENPLTLRLMRLIDEQFLETPFYGSRQMTRWLRRQGDMVSRKRVRRLMRLLGVHALYQRPRTSQPHPAHRIYPYLLRDLPITRPNHV